MAQTTKYVIKYKLNGERRFEFAQLENGTVEEAKAADEAFITSASAFVMPVVEVDGKAVGTGKPGAVVARLREIYLDEMRRAAV